MIRRIETSYALRKEMGDWSDSRRASQKALGRRDLRADSARHLDDRNEILKLSIISSERTHEDHLLELLYWLVAAIFAVHMWHSDSEALLRKTLIISWTSGSATAPMAFRIRGESGYQAFLRSCGFLTLETAIVPPRRDSLARRWDSFAEDTALSRDDIEGRPHRRIRVTFPDLGTSRLWPTRIRGVGLQFYRTPEVRFKTLGTIPCFFSGRENVSR